jgi:prolyl oligopeptidase
MTMNPDKSTTVADERSPAGAEDPADPHLWLEDLRGEGPLAWVRARNESTLTEFCDAEFERMRAEGLEIAESDDRIPYVNRRGEYLYNFWTDAANPRGLWRRTTLDSYRTDNPVWDVLIDVEALARADGQSWVLRKVDIIWPACTRALVWLSMGGADAAVVREFDMRTREFVPDGFTLPAGRHVISWEDENTLLVGTDFGEGSLTHLGRPRLVKRWRRGQPISDAELMFSCQESDMSASSSVDRSPGFERTIFIRHIDVFNEERYELRDGELIHLDVPTDAGVSVHRQWLLIRLRTDWQTAGGSYPAGSLLAADYKEFLAGAAQLQIVYEPDAHTSVHDTAWTRDMLLLVTLQDVATRVYGVTPGSWWRERLAGLPEHTTIRIRDADGEEDEFFLTSSGFTTPPTLWRGTAGGPLEPIKSGPARFDATGLVTSQHFATSDDGTQVPYFLVRHRDQTTPGPTLMEGYGAYGINFNPAYRGVTGRLWLARGGAYVLANIRGGCEYGPAWHTQAMRAGRHLVYEDFAAIARDLIDRGITTPAQLGATGGSAGGLLMGVMLTRHPELFGALVCPAPVLDMSAFRRLRASTGWMTEYGDPDDPADWTFLRDYSPYHNISADRHYPPVLIETNTNDDRVHPGHARKMAAALEAAGHRVLFYEDIEGGHSGAVDHNQGTFQIALKYQFLWRCLAG